MNREQHGLWAYTLGDEDLLLNILAVLPSMRDWCRNRDSSSLIQPVYYISGQNQPINFVSSALR